VRVSVVTTLYRSSPYIAEFYRRVVAAVSPRVADIELVFVDDGSPDDSLRQVKQFLHGQCTVRIVALARNYGHHPAIMTGLAHATGELVFLIDSDLEEPPELFSRLFDRIFDAPADEPIDVVFAKQIARKGKWFERVTGALFYRLFNLISPTQVPPNWMIARLMTRRYVHALLQHQEREIFLGGLMALTGFRQESIEGVKLDKGTSAYSMSKRVIATVNAVTSFSDRPLLFIFLMGSAFSVASLLSGAYMFVRVEFFGAQYAAGWPSMVVLINFFGGAILASIGVVGLYLARVFVEVKRRPCLVKEVITNERRA
jgi:putative glycosyltransferase